MQIFDFSNIRVLKKRHSLDRLDIAFVEGAIAGKDEEKKAKEIRKQARKVVAVGSCALIGMPSAQRNMFSPEQKKEIQFLLDRFSYLTAAKSLKRVVPVDYEVPGCPMDEENFLQTVDKLIEEFGL